MNGKSKCKILKDIRRQIAQDNDIEFITSECKYQGECSGTCPKCEAEVRYLEQELAKRQAAGKAIAVAGIAAALVVGSTGCCIEVNTTAGDPMPPSSSTQPQATTLPELDGEAIYPTTAGEPTEPTYNVTAGVPAPPEDPEKEFAGAVPLAALTGDIAIDYEEGENIYVLPGVTDAP